MKKIIIWVLSQLSKIIWYLIPSQIQKKYLSISGDLNIYDIYKKEEIINSYNYYKKHMQKSILLDTDEIRRYSIKKSLLNDKAGVKFNLEFGVYTGSSINLLSEFCHKIYGFDSFQGLRDDWSGTTFKSGSLNLNKKLPNVRQNVTLVQGWVEQTLENFLREHNPVINFCHIDLDIYTSSAFVLKKIKPFMGERAIILFDELYNYPGWECGEHKALKEVFNEKEYDFIAFSTTGSQAAIQLK